MNIRRATIEDAFGIAKVHVDSWRTTYTGIVPQHYLDSLIYEKRTLIWEQNIADTINEIYVSENENQEIVGFITGGTRDNNLDVNENVLTSIYILEEWQGNGIGKQLLKTMMQNFLKNGFTKIYVEVLSENKARNFYRYYGAECINTIQIDIAGKTIDEDIYVWHDINELLSKI